jgi:hypothetical protein
MHARQSELSDLLAQAGPKAKDIARELSRRSIHITVHITGPIVIGSEVASSLLPLLLESTCITQPDMRNSDKKIT